MSTGGFDQQKRKSKRASDVRLKSITGLSEASAPCKKCKTLKKVKRQLQEKTTALVETQDKLAQAETDNERLKSELKEVMQYLELIEKQLNDRASKDTGNQDASNIDQALS